jgi:5-dehydro-2-deoxygluconokinase
LARLVARSFKVTQWNDDVSQSEGFCMSVGYNRPLYVLPFDHRGSFQSGLFGWDGELDAAQVACVAGAKWVVYEGFKAALSQGIPKDRAGILVDEQFGEAILADAAKDGFITCAPAERSGQKEFDFEYGADFARHIEATDPTFCKVLVRYNPGGDAAMNARQATRLRQLSEDLHAHHRLFMFELLVPAEPAQLESLGGELAAYDRDLRPGLMVGAMRELQDAGVEPDVWKIEGLDSQQDCEEIVRGARRDGRADVGCIILGRGESEPKVIEWLRTAAAVPGFIGFAVGRTSFWDPLVAWRDNRVSAEEAAAEIASRYVTWVNIFEKARGSSAPAFAMR